MQHVDAGGRQYLELITTLLQRARLADPTAGLWEAADLQWWWRRDQHADPADARFWLDDDGWPVAAVVVTDWGDRRWCDVITGARGNGAAANAAWTDAQQRAQRMTPPIDMSMGDDDAIGQVLARQAGFTGTDESFVSCWMDAAARPAVSALAAGYRLVDRTSDPERPHHMIRRSGTPVAERLAECSLYRPELDLAVVAPDGSVAAYGLFWADPVTGVGLIEPMRTEDEHRNIGLGRHVLTAGLALLAEAGCTRFKVSYLDGYEPAKRLYLSGGFVPFSSSRTLVRSET
jgi:GNAT superfamily N-acetyltransferase